MLNRLVGIALTGLAATVSAQSVSMAELESKHAVALTREEIQTYVSGAQTTWTSGTDRRRIWTNRADGTVTASRYGTGMNPHRRVGFGNWRANDDGSFCVDFDWRSAETEKWCWRLYRVDGSIALHALDQAPEAVYGRITFER